MRGNFLVTIPLPAQKILFVITKSNWGGAQKYVYTLANAAHERGMRVTAVFGGESRERGSPGLLSEKLAAQRIRTVFVPSLSRNLSLTRDFRAYQDVKRVIRSERPDIVHLNSSKAGLIGALAARACKVRRIVFTAHGWPYRERRSFFSKLSIWIASWLTVMLSHAVIAVSVRDASHAPSLFFRKKITLIHNGVGRIPFLPPEEARNALSAFFPSSSDPATPYILAIGELTKNKAYDVLLRALSRVVSPFRCVIFGSGEERAALEELSHTLGLAARVVFSGFSERAATYAQGASLFVLPSRKEGFPFVLLEAGSAPLPIVASDTGGVRDLIEDGVSGILVKSEDPAAIARAIGMLLADAPKRDSLARALREKITASFSEKTMIDKTFALYGR